MSTERLYVRAKNSLTINDVYLSPPKYSWRKGDVIAHDNPYVLQYPQHFDPIPEYNGLEPKEAVDRGRKAVIEEAYRRAGGEQAKPVTTGGRTRPQDGRDGALRTLDGAVSRGLPSGAAERAQGLLDNGPEYARDVSARWINAAGSAEYESAFAKVVADPLRGHLKWNAQEQEAYERVSTIDAEMRSMATDPGSAGGFLLPVTLDPSIILTSDGSQDPLRRISRVIQVATNTWQGVTSSGATATWTPENQEFPDSTPTLAQPEIKAEKGAAEVQFSVELGQDANALLTELARLISDEFDQLHAEAFINGDGDDKPFGVLAGLTASETVSTGGNFTSAHVYETQEALPPRFQDRAVWIANNSVINTVTQMETTNGARLFPSVDSDRPSLIRRRLYEASQLEGNAATNGSSLLVYGNFSNFVIIDRVGTRVELDPHVRDGENNRWTGKRSLMALFRTGAKVVNPNAFRVLEKTA